VKTSIPAILFSAASVAALPAVTITVANNVTNGTASGGSGSGAGLITTTSGTISSNRNLPVTTYTVTGVDLTSVGGTNSESFTLGYTATSDGSTAATPTFSGFGNVGVAGDGLVSNAETLTATIALTSTTFSNLSLTGFTYVRVGAMSNGEFGTFTWAGGSHNVGFGNTIANSTHGFVGKTSAILTVGPTSSPAAPGTSTLNFEGFGAEFVAVPEPGTASLAVLGAAALLRRRRRA
jgi:hypothetical protein